MATSKHSTSVKMVYLDATLLIVGEPDQVLLNEGEDFLACTPDKMDGTTRHKNDGTLLKERCNSAGIDMKDLRGLGRRGKKHKSVFTGRAVFLLIAIPQSFPLMIGKRRSMQLNPTSFRSKAEFFYKRIVMTLAVAKRGMPWRVLPHSHNYATGSSDPAQGNIEEKLKAARILHYHDARKSNFWSEFIKCLRDTHSVVANWLDYISPLKNEAHYYCRSMSKSLQYFRAKQESEYKKLSRVI